ncbi:hypothetical protein LF845_09780 [Deferribacterales bacterium Es71-Z0220]|uniref:CRISPR-associated protein Csx20 n=1 Tax=Deferrivibrio essentukiensis TaxID=2880922 RepID=UPI001F613B85|nr:hypothetical protein [Deferrivibrio essentukiensis]
MTKLFLLFSHKLTDKQITDAKESLGVEKFVYLPDDLQVIWSQVSPYSELPLIELNRIVDWLKFEANKGDYILVQGDFGATFYVVDFCLKNNLIPVYSTSRRISVEKNGNNGKIVKTNIFEHVTFRKYRYFAF